MKRYIVPLIILFFLIVSMLPFISGYRQTPQGTIYLGTVHYAVDYLYYLSHITQGQEKWLTTDYLSTTEPMPQVLVGWNYVLLGRIGSMLHISPIYMYEAGILIGAVLYLFSSYLVLRLVFPANWGMRVLAYLLFLFSTTLPRILTINGHLELHPYYSWENLGEPFLRFSSVPHHLLIQAAVFLIVAAVFLSHSTRKKRIRNAGIGIFAGWILGTLQPIQWAVLSGCIGLFIMIEAGILVYRHTSLQVIVRTLFPRYIPFITFIVVGLPCVLYLKLLLGREPFASAGAWEAAQSPNMDILTFIRYYGIVCILGVLSLPFFFHTANKIKLLIVEITVISLGIFFFPGIRSLPVLTFRYLSALEVFVYAASAAYGIMFLTSKARQFAPLLRSVIFTILFFLLVPLFFIQLNAKMVVEKNNGMYYLPEDTYKTFITARKLSTRSDAFLILWPYESIFPAISGRREYFTTKYSTIDFDKKTQNVYYFISGKMSLEQQKAFLQDNHLTYVIAAPDQVGGLPFLSPVYTGTNLTMYKVL